jgi:putative aldouronate transport system substrate-binding protein
MGKKFGGVTMFRQRKSLIALLLVVIMAVSLLAGCGEKPAPTPSQSASSDPTAAPTESAPAESKYQYKNDKTESLAIFYPFAGTQTPEGIADVKAELEKGMKDSVNVTMDWIIIPREGFEEKLNTMLVSGDQLDAGVGDMDDLGSMSTKPGLVRPLDDLLEKYGQNLKKAIPQDAWDAVKNSKGEIVAIPAYNRYFWQGAVIRKDWLDKVGMQVPKTLEELEAVMEAFKKMDANIIPASGASWYMEPLLAAAVNGGVTPNNEWDTVDPTGEKVVNGFLHPEYKKFLELYHRWIDNGWWNKDFLVTDDQQNEQLFVSGRVGILFTDAHSADRLEKIIQQTDANGKVTFLPVLDGPGGKAAFIANSGVDRIVWVNQNGPHPERVVQYFDWLFSDKANYMLARYGIEGKDWVKDGDKWTLPPEAEGDDNKRSYFDIFAPCVVEGFAMIRSDEPAINAEIDAAYKSVPVLQPKLKGFTANWDAIGNVNTIDIWGEMYNIAVKARPLSDYESLCEEYLKSGGSTIYDELTKQYQEWKATQK